MLIHSKLYSNWTKVIKNIDLYTFQLKEQNTKSFVERNIEFAGFGADGYCLVQNRNQIENLVLDIIIFIYR